MWCLAVAAVLFWMKSAMFLRLCRVELAVGSAGSLFASSVCAEGGWGEAATGFGHLGVLLVVPWGTLVSVFL